MTTQARLVCRGLLGLVVLLATIVLGLAPAGAVAPLSTLHAGQSLAVGGALVSAQGRYRLVLQSDGNLVIYTKAGRATWSSGTTTASLLSVQSDGNVTLRAQSGSVVWATQSAATAGATLAMQDDGNLVLYATNGGVLWSLTQGLALPMGVRTAAGARQLIVVTAANAITTYATLQTFSIGPNGWVTANPAMTARVGYNGWLPKSQRHEGDGTTPEGIFSIGATMYGNSPNPGVRYAYHQLVPGDYWDENPATGSLYNTFEHSTNTNCAANPFGGDTECLWRETAPYPSFAVINFNIPATGASGSGVFLHASGGATAGCVSLGLSDLLTVLRWLDPASHPEVVLAGPSSPSLY
jgi:L,D-peptidoglycan transpeptidase YkuD (ErfK/YbiS/YcfS/YnhG family)